MGLIRLTCFVAYSALLTASAGANAAPDEMDVIAAKLKSGDFSVVKSNLTQLANSGNDRAQFNLAVSYSHGNGVERNHTEAFKWYQKAAQQGNTRAEVNLANSYLDGVGTEKNSEEAIKWYEAAANDGDVVANIALGKIYSLGAENIAPDYAKAFGYFSAASQKGSDEADFNLGGMYLFGAGTAKDAPKAIELYKGLAAKGNERAAMILGEIYSNDKYVQPDLPRSYAWYKVQYDANQSAEAKSMMDSLKPFLNKGQIEEAAKIQGGIIFSGNQFSKAN